MNVVLPKPDSPATLIELAFSLLKLSSQRVSYHYRKSSSPLGDNLVSTIPVRSPSMRPCADAMRTSGWGAEQETVSIGCYDL